MPAIDDYIGKVHQIDALELMKALPSQSVNAIITDLPYGTTANEWESGIALSDTLWAEMWRVCTPFSPVITTASQPFTSLLTVKCLKQFRHEWIWEKTRASGYLNANIAPMKAHENILVFSQQSIPFYPQMTYGKPYRAIRGAVGGYVHDKTVGGYETVNDGWRYPTSVLRFESVANGYHPTQKPLALYDYLIRTYTQIGDIVLDPFAGSGTTGVAARNLERRYILGDTNATYCDIARKRLDEPYTLNMFVEQEKQEREIQLSML